MIEFIDWWLRMSIDIIQKKTEYQKHDRYDRKKDRGLEMTIGKNEKNNHLLIIQNVNCETEWNYRLVSFGGKEFISNDIFKIS